MAVTIKLHRSLAILKALGRLPNMLLFAVSVRRKI
jgi:hypothetical protein